MLFRSVCAATVALRRHVPSGDMGPALFVIPFGPVVPALAFVVALSILVGATPAQLGSGVAALVAGAVLFAVAPRGSQGYTASMSRGSAPPSNPK